MTLDSLKGVEVDEGEGDIGIVGVDLDVGVTVGISNLLLVVVGGILDPPPPL